MATLNTVNSTTKIKKITLITKAPQGTLGDPSTALKFLSALKAEYGDKVDLSLIVYINDAVNMDKINKLNIPEGVQFIPVTPADNNSDRIDKNLLSSDCLIVYPAPQLFSEQEMTKLGEYKKPLIIGTEYDYDKAGKPINSLPWSVSFKTGFSSRSLGVYLTQEPIVDNKNWLSLLKNEEDLSVKNFFLAEAQLKNIDYQEAEKKYFNSHDLYFAYFNNINAQHKLSNAHPIRFINACVKKSKSQPGTSKNIDIFIPLQTEEHKMGNTKPLTNINQIFGFCKKNPIYNEITIEYYNKDAKGELVLRDSLGTGDTTLRIINGFPITSDGMDKMMKASDPFCLVTGDQSLSEALSNNKIFSYQIMLWKKVAFDHLIEKSTEYLGAQSDLVKFFSLQRVDLKEHNIGWQKLEDLIINKESQLLSEMKVFKEKLLENDNIYNKISDVMTLIDKPEAYIEKCINKLETTTDIEKLAAIFPDMKNYIYEEMLNKIKKNPSTSYELTFLSELLPNYLGEVKNMLIEKIISSLPEKLKYKKHPNSNDYFTKLDDFTSLFPEINDKDKLKLFSSAFCACYNENSFNKKAQYGLQMLLMKPSSQHQKNIEMMLNNMKSEDFKKSLLDFLFIQQKNLAYVQDFLHTAFFDNYSILNQVGIFLLTQYSQKEDRKLIFDFVNQQIDDILKSSKVNDYFNFENMFAQYISSDEIKEYFIDSRMNTNPPSSIMTALEKIYLIKKNQEASSQSAFAIKQSGLQRSGDLEPGENINLSKKNSI